MIISNNLIKLEYNPVTDILNVEWPNISSDHTTEVKHTLKAIVDTIKHYDVKKLLIDARQTVVRIPQTEYEAILKDFSLNLNATRLKMVARVESENPARESLVKEIGTRLKHLATLEFQSFASTTDAITWLEKNTYSVPRLV